MSQHLVAIPRLFSATYIDLEASSGALPDEESLKSLIISRMRRTYSTTFSYNISKIFNKCVKATFASFIIIESHFRNSSVSWTPRSKSLERLGFTVEKSWLQESMTHCSMTFDHEEQRWPTVLWLLTVKNSCVPLFLDFWPWETEKTFCSETLGCEEQLEFTIVSPLTVRNRDYRLFWDSWSWRTTGTLCSMTFDREKQLGLTDLWHFLKSTKDRPLLWDSWPKECTLPCWPMTLDRKHSRWPTDLWPLTGVSLR